MSDTMKVTKIAAGVLGAWLVLLLGKWAGEELYHAEAHGDPSYVIEVASAEEEREEEIDMVALMASADLTSGAKVFKKCSSCHKLKAGANGAGPYLYGVVGRDVGAADGFGYSGALSEVADVWTQEELFAFLEKPSSYAKGTSMSFAGLKKPQDRADVIAYLESISD